MTRQSVFTPCSDKESHDEGVICVCVDLIFEYDDATFLTLFPPLSIHVLFHEALHSAGKKEMRTAKKIKTKERVDEQAT